MILVTKRLKMRIIQCESEVWYKNCHQDARVATGYFSDDQFLRLERSTFRLSPVHFHRVFQEQMKLFLQTFAIVN